VRRLDVVETERARRASRVSASGEPAPDPEVPEGPKRRRFIAEYRRRIRREADRCKGSGEIGALPRPEGLYSSHLTNWRRRREDYRGEEKVPMTTAAGRRRVRGDDGTRREDA
jgi:hypothetical protein